MVIDPKGVGDWITLGVLVIGWIVSGVVAWQRMVGKLNGLGGRVEKVETTCSTNDGRMDRIERELTEYRRDAQNAVEKMSRVEKGIDAAREEIEHGNRALEAQLRDVNKAITDNDRKTTNRLVRMETLAKVEDKIGPIPLD